MNILARRTSHNNHNAVGGDAVSSTRYYGQNNITLDLSQMGSKLGEASSHLQSKYNNSGGQIIPQSNYYEEKNNKNNILRSSGLRLTKTKATERDYNKVKKNKHGSQQLAIQGNLMGL